MNTQAHYLYSTKRFYIRTEDGRDIGWDGQPKQGTWPITREYLDTCANFSTQSEAAEFCRKNGHTLGLSN